MSTHYPPRLALLFVGSVSICKVLCMIMHDSKKKKKKKKKNPNTIPHDAWIDDVKAWPEVDDGKLFSYILRTKAVDVEYIGKYKDQKAYSYWMSGFVDTVLFTKCPIDCKHVFLKAVCHHHKKFAMTHTRSGYV